MGIAGRSMSPPHPILSTAVASTYSVEAATQWKKVARTVEQSLDSTALVNQAIRLGLAPMLYRAVRDQSVPRLHSGGMRALQEAYIHTTAQNALAMKTLAVILRALSEADVPVILLKGAALLATVYDDIGLRPMADLDLLVPFQTLEQCLAALERQGYEPTEIFPFQDKTGYCWGQLALEKADAHDVVLELHWHLLDNPHYAQKMSAGALLPRSRQVAFADQNVRILNPEEQILHLCAHSLYHHRGEVARTCVDLALIAQTEPIDWDYLLNVAVDRDIVLALQKTLIQAVDNWYAVVPDSIIEQLATLEPRPVERFFVATQRSEFLKVLRTLFMLPGWSERSHFAFRQLFPTKHFMVWRYGISPSTPLAVAYGKRYAAGIRGLVGELSHQ